MRFFLLAIGCWLIIQQPATAQAVTDSVAWHRISLSPEASIRLPGSVTTKLGRDTAIKIFSAYNQRVVYTAVAKKLTWPTALAAELNPDAVYQGVIKGAINNLAAGRTVRQTPFMLAGRRGLEVQLDLPNQPNLAPARYLRALYANGWLYIYSWRQAATPAAKSLPDDAADRHSFFAAFQLRHGARSFATALVAGGRIGWGLFQSLALVSVLLAATALAWRSYRRT